MPPGFMVTDLGDTAPRSQAWVGGMAAGHGPRAHKHASARSLGLERGWVCVCVGGTPGPFQIPWLCRPDLAAPCFSSGPVKGVEGFHVLSTDYSYGVVCVPWAGLAGPPRPCCSSVSPMATSQEWACGVLGCRGAEGRQAQRGRPLPQLGLRDRGPQTPGHPRWTQILTARRANMVGLHGVPPSWLADGCRVAAPSAGERAPVSSS